MSVFETLKKSHIQLRLILVPAILALAGLAGFWFGKWSVFEYTPATPDGMTLQTADAQKEGNPQNPPESYVDPDVPLIFLHIGGDICGSIDREEIAMAASAGLHQYVITIPAPWNGAADLADILSRVQCVADADPLAALLLRIDFNPPETWLSTHPDEQITVAGKAQAFPCPASGLWLNAAQESIRVLTNGIASGTLAKRILGYMVSALEDRRWLQSGFDTSAANAQGFRAWLHNQYVDDGALRGAWGDEQITLDSASIPQKTDTGNLKKVFYSLPQEQPIVDFLHYVSDSTADAIAALASELRSQAGPETQILAPYGFSLELLNNDAGHFSLGAIIDSDVDGYVSPVSYVDRGLGGAGGMMGPVNTAEYHGRRWFLIDDTRTGIAKDPATGAITRLKGIHPEDVYHVQQRNFAAALTQDLGLFWSDPEGAGWLHDQEQWTEFKKMLDIATKQLHASDTPPPAPPEKTVADIPSFPETTPSENEASAIPPQENSLADMPPSPEETPPVENSTTSPPPESSDLSGETPVSESTAAIPETIAAPPDTPPPPEYATGLLVVVDESSRFYQQCDAPLNELLLQKGRDAALRSGAAAQFCLLQDVLDDRNPPAPVYLFLNAFHLTKSQRERLHERMVRDQACAMWVYAPGYIDAEPSVDNISETTQIHTAAFDGPAQTGSLFALAGQWMNEGQSFGTSLEIGPLFYIDDKEADVLANYQTSGRSSVAMRSLAAGWTSVFIADPSVTASLLRELLRILEQHLYFRESADEHLDTLYVGRGLLAVHAKGSGDRPIALGNYYDVQDLFDSALGWPQKDSFLLPLQTGDTRLLKLTPLWNAP